MARGSYMRESSGELPIEVSANIPARATRKLQKASSEEVNTKSGILAPTIRQSSARGQVALSSGSPRFANSIGLAKLFLLLHKRNLLLWFICLFFGVLFLSVLLSAAFNLR